MTSFSEFADLDQEISSERNDEIDSGVGDLQSLVESPPQTPSSSSSLNEDIFDDVFIEKGERHSTLSNFVHTQVH